VLPLGVSFQRRGFGLLLVANLATLSVHWFAASSRRRSIDPPQTALTDARQGANGCCSTTSSTVTDPILLTDTEGRLLIANRAPSRCFGVEEGEGRRGAVRMNNMLLSSALSARRLRKPARRAAAAAVIPSRIGLLFSSSAVGGSAAGQRCRDSAQRQRPASREQEIEENYRKLRVADRRPGPKAIGST
jgi:hypothetical protein